MTILQAINAADAKIPNAVDTATKIIWLSAVDMRFYNQSIMTHAGEHPLFDGYREDTPVDTGLLIEQPYDEAYIHYLAAMIHLNNEDYDRYNNEATLYRDIYDEYARLYNCRHSSLQPKFKLV